MSRDFDAAMDYEQQALPAGGRFTCLSIGLSSPGFSLQGAFARRVC
jgi:hypothetical protein